jgi:hypothetical protein
MGNLLKPVCKNCKKEYAEVKEGECYSFIQRLVNPSTATYLFPCLDLDKNEITFADYNDRDVKENRLIVFYDHRTMFIALTKEDVASGEMNKNRPVMPNGRFFCPDCREFDLYFHHAGIWE